MSAINKALQEIDEFIQSNPNINLHSENFNSSAWSSQEKIIKALKALQRLLRIYNDLPTAKKLFAAGVHSAVQITAIPKQYFINKYSHCFHEDIQQTERFYQRATARKNQLLLQSMYVHQSRERHTRASKFLTNSKF